MFQTTKFKKCLAILVLGIIFSSLVLQVLYSTRSEASYSETKILKPVQLAVAKPALPSPTDVICAVAIPGAAVTGICDTVVDTVASVAEGIDCVASIENCVTKMGFKLFGGMVAWGVDGVVTLVANVHEECLSTQGSGGYTDELVSSCEDRIKKDYSVTSNNDGGFNTPKSPVASEAFGREYKKYALIGFMIFVPMIIAACIQSIISGKGVLMLKSVFLVLPLSIFGMAIAPWLVKSLMMITDSISAFVVSDVKVDIKNYFGNVGASGDLESQTITMLLPFGLIAIVFVMAAIALWMVLTMREASIALIAVFLPIAFAASVWPALSKWAIRAIKLLMAAIISKIFIVGALSLGIATFSGAATNQSLSLSRLIYGAIIFSISAFSPKLVTQFFDEIGDAAATVAGATGVLAKGHGLVGQASNAQGAKNLAMSALGAMKKPGLPGGAGAAPGALAGTGAPGAATSVASKAAKAATNAATAPKGGGGKGPGGSASPSGGGKGPSGTGSGGSGGAGATLPAGASGGIPMGGSSAGGLSLPSSYGDASSPGAGGGDLSSPVMASNLESGAQFEAGPGASAGGIGIGDTPVLGGSGSGITPPVPPVVLPKAHNRLVRSGQAQFADGIRSGSTSSKLKGIAKIAVGSIATPSTAIMPGFGAAKGVGNAAKTIHDINKRMK